MFDDFAVFSRHGFNTFQIGLIILNRLIGCAAGCSQRFQRPLQIRHVGAPIAAVADSAIVGVVADISLLFVALQVDEVIGKQEVVIKSLDERFTATNGVAGGAILGDGRVGLILDIRTIFDSRLQGDKSILEGAV